MWDVCTYISFCVFSNSHWHCFNSVVYSYSAGDDSVLVSSQRRWQINSCVEIVWLFTIKEKCFVVFIIYFHFTWYFRDVYLDCKVGRHLPNALSVGVLLNGLKRTPFKRLLQKSTFKKSRSHNAANMQKFIRYAQTYIFVSCYLHKVQEVNNNKEK
jgi:hypothetical protein